MTKISPSTMFSLESEQDNPDRTVPDTPETYSARDFWNIDVRLSRLTFDAAENGDTWPGIDDSVDNSVVVGAEVGPELDMILEYMEIYDELSGNKHYAMILLNVDVNDSVQHEDVEENLFSSAPVET